MAYAAAFLRRNGPRGQNDLHNITAKIGKCLRTNGLNCQENFRIIMATKSQRLNLKSPGSYKNSTAGQDVAIGNANIKWLHCNRSPLPGEYII